MAVKDPKKAARILSILCIFIGLAALTVGILAVAKEEYIIAVAMILVVAWQVINYKKWRKCL